MKVELCNFSGMKIYPSKGKTYVRGDSKVSWVLEDRDSARR
jgi:large subunit ribosomal protein L24e